MNLYVPSQDCTLHTDFWLDRLTEMYVVLSCVIALLVGFSNSYMEMGKTPARNGNLMVGSIFRDSFERSAEAITLAGSTICRGHHFGGIHMASIGKCKGSACGSFHCRKCSECGYTQRYGREWGSNKYPGLEPITQPCPKRSTETAAATGEYE